MSEELKACPHCGGKAAVYGVDSYYVACCRCEAQTARYKTAQEAIVNWNRRAEPENKPLICPLLSDVEVKQPCLEGPCPAILNEPLTLEQVKQLKPGTPVIIVCNDKLENIKNFGINFELNYWGDGDIADGTIKVYARKPEGSCSMA